MAGNLGETVMADAKISIAKTLVNEGGYVDNPNDSGGPTKYGITQRDLPGEDIEKLTPERATAYYLENYWKALYSQIDSQAVADKIFDMGVLFGVGTAIKLLQTILNLSGIDGVFGVISLAKTNEAEPVSLISSYRAALVSHGIGIANAQPKDRVFLTGWIKRINS